MTKRELIQITEPYIDKKIDYKKLSKTTGDYRSFLEGLVEVDLESDKNRSDLYFKNGKALGTKWAAMCLDDIMRTRVFVKGVYEAVMDLLSQHEKVRICYAGTGPFATLLIPTLIRVDPERIECLFIEINETSMSSLKKVMAHDLFKLCKINFEQADLTEFLFSQNEKPHLIVSETMQNLLEKEQQVPIFINLMRQCPPSTVFIPEVVSVDLAIESSIGLNSKRYHTLDTLFEVSKNTLKSSLNKSLLQKKNKTISDNMISRSSHLSLLTQIQVYGLNQLRVNESGLTVARPLSRATNNDKVLSYQSHYEIGEIPKLHFNID